MAERLVAKRIDHRARFVCRVNMGDDDAERATIQAARRQRQLTTWHTDNRRDARIQRRDADLVRGFYRGRPVFQIDEQPIVPRGFHDARNLHAAHRFDAHADR